MSKETLQEFIQNVELVDNHAHQLYRDFSKDSLKKVFSEATGDALDNVKHSIAYKNGVRSLQRFVEEKGKGNAWRNDDPIGYATEMLKDTRTSHVLFDDGLYGDFLEFEQHPFQTTRRIVRIERVAENIARDLQKTLLEHANSLVGTFTSQFKLRLSGMMKRQDVVGLKSIAAYRSGLAIEVGRRAEEEYVDALKTFINSENPRLRDKGLVDLLINIACQLSSNFPFQFHTGHGDNDLKISLADPSLMQPLIKAYPKVKFVLLHASWPFTKQAAWLASSYANVWVDYGEIQPQMSRKLLRDSLHDLIGFAPNNRILYSSDGHCWPETFWISAGLFRECLSRVLQDLIDDGDLILEEAKEIAGKICRDNATELYKLSE